MLDSNYVVGLVDGEGSFTVYVRDPKHNTHRVRRVSVELRFYIKLVEEDKDILYQLQEFFGCGSVYQQKDRRHNHKHCYRYEVFNREDLRNIIIPFFLQHRLRFPSKQHDFELFAQIVELVQKDTHKTEEGLAELHNIKQQMH